LPWGVRNPQLLITRNICFKMVQSAVEMPQIILRVSKKYAHTSKRWCLWFFFPLENCSVYKTAFKAKMTVVSLAEESLSADGDALLCNWNFKSTFQCLSLAARRELMT